MMVEMWHSILRPFVQNDQQLKRMSLNVQRVCYGFVLQTLLIEPDFTEWELLEEDIIQSLRNCFFYKNKL